MTLSSDIFTLYIHTRLRVLCFFQAFRGYKTGYLAWISLFLCLLLYGGCWIFAFPPATKFIESKFLTIIDMFGLDVGLRCMSLLHVLFMGVYLIPLADQMYNTLCFSSSIKVLYHHLRSPSAIPVILITEAVIMAVFVEIILWPCLWSPFILTLPAGGILSILLLKGVVLGVVLIIVVLWVTAHLWCNTLRHGVMVAWITTIGYYASVGWFGYKRYLELSSSSEGKMAVEILQFMYQAIDGEHNIQTLFVGLAIWALVLWYGRVVLAWAIQRWGIENE